MNKGEFMHRVQALSGISDAHQAERLTGAVLGTLCGRITHEESRDLESQLPSGIDEMCKGSVLRELMSRVTGPDRLEREAFVDRVCEEAKLGDVAVAERVTVAVFRTLKEQITAGEAQDVADQLPKRLKVMWLES